MSEELEVLQDVVRRLEEAGLPYMVTGSLAVSFYAQPRLTRDIDIVLEIGSGDVARLNDLFARDFYIDQAAIQDAINRRSSFNIIHNASIIKIDFIVRKPDVYRKVEFKRRRKMMIDGAEVAVVAAEDLVLSKLIWGKDSHSELQMGDARSVLKQAKELDYSYMERWAEHLGIVHLYHEALR
ncbi:MAG: nucleotidyltransferase [Dehalococcoidia bacterium]|nr:nucleotidyltransferase [Dehalococcoidia bacterium]